MHIIVFVHYILFQMRPFRDIIVKLREREGKGSTQEVDCQLSIVDCLLSIVDIYFPEALH